MKRWERSILMSIEPKFVEKIFSGEKTVEYRRGLPDFVNEVVIIYASSPVNKIVGEFSVLTMQAGPKELIWARTHEKGCVNKEWFDSYFSETVHAGCVDISKPIKYDEEKLLSDFGVFDPPEPESFKYVNVYA